MSARAGWYPDPSGDATKLRFWDGNQWTNDFMDAAAVPPSNTQAGVQSQVDQGLQLSSPANQQAGQAGYQQSYQTGYQQSYQAGQTYQQPQQNYQQPNYSTPYTTAYTLSNTDTTLRLIAFIFCVLTLCSVVASGIASFGLLLIPLAWVIPMTVVCWKIYKGERPNTVAFGVCMLLFVNLISGILLLCSSKEA